MIEKLTIAVLFVVMSFSSMAQDKVSDVPMTNPSLVLSTYKHHYGHSVSFLELADGRILMCGGHEFRISNDSGMTWSEPYRSVDEKGQRLDYGSMSAIVRLSGNSIGVAHRPRPGRSTMREWETLFRHSEDSGKTWSAPVVMNPHGPTAIPLQDELIRTASGRIILPVYLGIGQPGYPRTSTQEAAPIVGAYLNGIFVTTNAHFYDSAFGASFVLYSDDDGKTWRRNKDGELYINLEPGGYMEPTFEPSVTEVSPGKLLMIMRTGLGRLFQAWSEDNGGTWTRPPPTSLAATTTPGQIRRLRNGHLLLVWNQESEQEVRRGFNRTRISSAVSRNGGSVWEFFKTWSPGSRAHGLNQGPYAPSGRLSST